MKNIKSEIIPESMKLNIDEILEKQLFNANRYYAESNHNISKLMKAELSCTPEDFYRKLVERWKWHNIFYEELLEPAYCNLIRDDYKELSISELNELVEVYKTACLVDEATLIMSGSIKKYLDYKTKIISTITENISSSEANYMLITPPVETFFSQFNIDHLFYIYLIKTESSEIQEFKEYLKSKYHANDELVFKTRFEKKFKRYFNLSKKELLADIKKYSISDDYKIKHYYFTLEHSDRRAVRDIIIYDNLHEKLIASNLIGISGFLLRKKILAYLNNSGILKNRGYIYEFSNDTIVDDLNILKKEKVRVMDKNIKPYKQRGDTCAIACLMMALEYYNVIEKANWYDERRLYKIYGSKYMSGTPFSALAYHFSKNGLNTTLYHEDSNLFNNNKNALSEENFNFAMDEYKQYLKRAEDNSAKVVNGIIINSRLIRSKLEEGNIVILAGQNPGGGYHAIIVSGYENDEFIVCDPQYKTKQYKKCDEIDKFINTDIGKWFITVNNNSKEKQTLMNALESYNNKANEILENKEEVKKVYEKK